MNDFKKIICCALLILSPWLTFAQKTKQADIILKDTALLSGSLTNKVCIKDLVVTGTKKTKIYIVYREIQFKKGDSLLKIGRASCRERV